jgi:hypothetical protein
MPQVWVPASGAGVMPFGLEDFVTESNRIEGLGPAQPHEVQAHVDYLALPALTTEALERFVARITVPVAKLRAHRGMDVVVGHHRPPLGGARIVSDLRALLFLVNTHEIPAYDAHHQYETLHPFMDGNGRSGRLLWLWMMGGIQKVPLGFLHTWYYQSLEAERHMVSLRNG